MVAPALWKMEGQILGIIAPWACHVEKPPTPRSDPPGSGAHCSASTEPPVVHGWGWAAGQHWAHPSAPGQHRKAGCGAGGHRRP